MDLQRSVLPAGEPLNVVAAALLMLAGKTACANETPSWGHEHACALRDALLTLAAEHGFAQADTLREKLSTSTQTDRTQRLAEIAFEPVPASAVLDVIRQSSFYIGE
ncbi:hypothetical protein J6352_09620 [Burkholderia pseudomallei]|nr:hypothetical protein [Burkholderia pseudomallei]MBO7905641.1 hypothetical protein [Burkholderia pseudomallei]